MNDIFPACGLCVCVRSGTAAAGGEEKKDRAKLLFIKRAALSQHEFKGSEDLDESLCGILGWLSKQSPEEVRSYREKVLAFAWRFGPPLLSFAAVRHRWCRGLRTRLSACRIAARVNSGSLEPKIRHGVSAHTPPGCWAARVLGAVAVQVAGVVRDVNGPLMEVLAQAIAYHDAGVVDMLRDGGLLFGLLKCTGNGRPSEPLLKCSEQEVHEGLEARMRLSICAACATYVLHVCRSGIEQC